VAIRVQKVKFNVFIFQLYLYVGKWRCNSTRCYSWHYMKLRDQISVHIHWVGGT